MLQVVLFTCYKLQCLLVVCTSNEHYITKDHILNLCVSLTVLPIHDPPTNFLFVFLFILSLYLSVLLVCLFVFRYLCVIHLPVCWVSTSNVQTLIPCNGVSSMLFLKPAPLELLYIRYQALDFSPIFGCLKNKMYFWSPLS